MALRLALPDSAHRIAQLCLRTPTPHRLALWTKLAVFTLAAYASTPATLVADLHETFEAVDTSWLAGDHDCPFSVNVHRRVFGDAHQGQGSEFLAYRTGTGTLARIVHPVLPTRVIDELSISVWVRSERDGIQLQARVVLPRTIDPRTGKPLHYWLTGDVYAASGHWKQLNLTQPRSKLEQVVFTLRSQLRTRIDPAEAYIDQVGLNIYTGRGAHRLWIDDLELRGQALLAVPSQPAVSDRLHPAAAEREGHPAVEFRGDMLFAEGRPLSIRAIDYHGESLDLLTRLRFNCVVLQRVPDDALVRQFAAHHLWWIAPLPLDPSAAPSLRRLAFLWPTEVEARDAEMVRARVEQYRRGGNRTILLARVRSGMTEYSHLFDGIILTRPVIGTTLPLSDYLQWIKQQRAAMRMDMPVWVSLNAEIPSSVERQIAALGGQDESQFVSSDAVEIAALSVAQLGIRSMWFRTSRPLEGVDAGSIRRQYGLMRVCRTLDLMTPWLAAGKVIATADSSSPTLRGVLLRSDAARLLLAVRRAPGVACVPPAWEPSPVTLRVDGIPATDEAFTVGSHGLVRLKTQQASSLRIVVDKPENKSLALMTRDVSAIQFVATRLRQAPQERFSLLRDDVRQELEWTRVTLQRLQPWLRSTDAGRDEQWQTAERHYKQVEYLYRSRDYDRMTAEATKLRNALREVQRAQWEEAVAGLEHPAASPFCLTFYSLPLHWMWVSRVWNMHWSPNQLVGGDFEDVRHLQASGWIYNATLNPRLNPQVRISPTETYSGRGAVVLSCEDPGGLARLDGTPLATIQSPPVRLTKGQWVRISGWVRIDRPLTGGVDGLRVVDSIGGIALSQSIRQTDGWQQVNLYRIATDNQPVRVTIGLHGFGTVRLDSFQVQVAQP